jgi:tetratricopeptide (TPR) repeat protein
MKRLYFLLLVILTLSMVSAGQSIPQEPAGAFKSGIDMYSAGKYQEALDAWLVLYNSGYRTAAIEYNIGNAYFKLENVPGSILFYERALLLTPADEDILYNLQIAKALTVDKFSEIPELFFVTWFNFVSLYLSTNAWAILALITFLLFLASLSLYFYSRSFRFKVIGFWVALFMLLFSVLSISFSLRNNKLVFNSDKAIIMAPQVNGKSSPDQSGTDLFLLHEGTKVTVGDKVGEWFEIRLSDGNKGWIPSNSLEKL